MPTFEVFVLVAGCKTLCNFASGSRVLLACIAFCLRVFCLRAFCLRALRLRALLKSRPTVCNFASGSRTIVRWCWCLAVISGEGPWARGRVARRL